MAKRSAEPDARPPDGGARRPPWARDSALAREQKSAADTPSVLPRLDFCARAQPNGPLRGVESPLLDSTRRLRLHDEIGDKLLAGDSSDEPAQGQHYLKWMARLALLFLLAGAAYGVSLFIASDTETSSDGGVPAASRQPAQGAAPMLVVEPSRTYANEPLLLKVSLQGASGREFLLLSGLEEQTRLSAGKLVAPNEWRLSPFDLGNLFAYSPHDYVGSMQAAVDLYSADGHKLASQTLRLEWIATGRTAAVPLALESPEPEQRLTKPVIQEDPEASALLERGRELLKLGDIAAARVFLRRSAEGGKAQAALLLGSTFDPRALRESGVLGLAPDRAQARFWYEKAVALGLPEAIERIEGLGAGN